MRAEVQVCEHYVIVWKSISRTNWPHHGSPSLWLKHTSQSSYIWHQSCGKIGWKSFFRSIVLPIMSPYHIGVISSQHPLKAITAPVATPWQHLSKISVWAAAGMTSYFLLLSKNSWVEPLWLSTWMTTVDGNQITLCDSLPSKQGIMLSELNWKPSISLKLLR